MTYENLFYVDEAAAAPLPEAYIFSRGLSPSDAKFFSIKLNLDRWLHGWLYYLFPVSESYGKESGNVNDLVESEAFTCDACCLIY